jgi:MFS family permease
VSDSPARAELPPTGLGGGGFRWPWILSLASGVAVAFGAMFYAYSVLLTDEAAGAEFTTTALSVAYGGFVLTGGGLAYVIGRRADRIGIRPLAMLGFTLGALGLIGLGRATAPWQVVATSWLLMGPAGGLTFYEPAFVAVNQWFGSGHRARALAVLTLIGGLAGPLFLPLTERLVSSMGWRDSTYVLAALMAMMGLVDAVVLPRGRPGTGPSNRPERRTPLRRDRRFVLFTIAMALSFGAFQAIFFHRIAAFEEAGFGVAAVTAWAAASSLLSLPGRYAGPYLAERAGGITVYAAAAIVAGAATVLMVGGGTWRMPAHFIAFGITFGGMLPIRAVVMAHWYSGDDYGTVMGAQWSVAAVVGALVPAVIGAVRDQIGEYGPALLGIAILFGLAAGAALAAGRSRVPPRD